MTNPNENPYFEPGFDSRFAAQPTVKRRTLQDAVRDSAIGAIQRAAAQQGYHVNDDGTIDIEPDPEQKRQLEEQAERHARYAKANSEPDEIKVARVLLQIAVNQGLTPDASYRQKLDAVYHATRANKWARNNYPFIEELQDDQDYIDEVWSLAWKIFERNAAAM